MTNYVMGIDLGTTSIKVVLLDSSSKAVVESCSVPSASDINDNSDLRAKEQDTGKIIRTLNECIAFLPKDKLQKDMLNVSADSPKMNARFAVAYALQNLCGGCEWSNRDFFIAKDTSQLITWQDGRCSSNFLSSLPKPDSHLSLATGFGCTTILWYMKHRPEFFADFTVAGTVQDYVVSMLCGLEKCTMTPQNAASWGYFNTTSNQWNMDILMDAGFPLHLLPECVTSGCLAGHTCSEWHGIPAHTPVGAALGDFQCSVYSCMTFQTDAVLNISTSAQLTYAMAAGFKPPDVPQPTSSISYFPYFDDGYLAVAASLNGGNVLATFVGVLSAWMKELGAEVSDSSLYEKLIDCALRRENSDLRVSPTVMGERHNPLCLGHVSNISTSNLSLGHVTRALCRGVLENLTSMMPAVLLQEAGVARVIGSGSALSRNEVLRQEVEKAFPQPVEYGQNVDSAVGVAMVFCDRQ